MKVDQSRERIFVSIVSYRDPDTVKTILSLFQSALRPARIFVGVVWQCKLDEDQAFMQVPSTYRNQVKSHVVDFSDARGPMYARSLCERLYDNEEFYLQIDSHMRFRKHYDQDLISWYYECLRAGEHKPVISAYPGGFSVTDISTEQAPWKEPVNAMVAQPNVDKDGFVRLSGKPIKSNSSHYLNRSLFVAAGFMFCLAQAIIQDARHSQAFPFSFFGEELLLSMRLFTHGYNFYLPRYAIVRHAWERTHRPTFQELLRDEQTGEQLRKTQQASKEKLLHIIYNDPEISGDPSPARSLFGTVRSCSAFWSERGIDPKERTIGEPALSGGFAPEEFVHTIAQLNDIDLMARISKFL